MPELPNANSRLRELGSRFVRHMAQRPAAHQWAFIGGISALALVTALSLFSGSTPTLQAETQPVPVPEISEPELFAAITAQTSSIGKSVALTLKPGDSLGPILQKNGVSPSQAYAVTQAFATAFNPRDLRAGQTVKLYFDDSETPQLATVTVKPALERTVMVNRTPEGDYKARNLTVTFPSEIVQISGTIENSLYLDAGRLGAPDKVTVQFSQIYEHSVDFQRDIQPGDAFTMAFEVYRDRKGNPVKAGDLLYASFAPRGKTQSFYLYVNKAGDENYFDAEGKSAKRKLMRTPVNGARLSSGYGKRKHPVLGYVKSHKGVDFAAPRGTPIMAAGVGTVERANRFGSFGNYVLIRHSDGYKTAYAHLNTFARGITAGARVTQGQTIGYVGTTGRSTGPHLHYEVHKNGAAINPSSLSMLSGKPLPPDEAARFAQRRKEIDALRTAAGPVFAPRPAEPAQQLASASTAP